ncbi:hypothetical protein EV138_0239 [Kribbella voronezhensis]|uniref:4-amino-4-deoxy-L-arabinose transferase-like glycosyltransferase n=1 Tax=Kribbella voronezhensis TaxID=2512212 RepID=A0A4R7T4H0_9ACTN|nr:hypothetical protein [Kribbella voronezhensis]TDU86724.1 hypothetical protein EV138_0239 [Kribbella voronezhensis]
MRGIESVPARLAKVVSGAPDIAVLRAVVLAVAIVQACVLGLLARRGSWMSDDIEFLVQGDRGFAPGELLTPVNDHIAPGLRFVYALFATIAPLNWDVTIAWRVLMQAIAIALMGLLLLRLIGPSRWALTGTLLYALTPLSMPSFMSLSSAVNNLPAHVFGLLLLHATLDWYAGHRRRAVAYGPLSLLISLACWEKSGLIVFTAVALALYLRDRPIRQWVRQSLPFAAALVAPIVAFGILYLTHGRPSAGRLPGFGRLLDLGAHSFAVPLAALVGGPWEWNALAPPFGTAATPVAAVVLGGIVAAFLLMVAWRQDRRALLVWASVLIYVLVTLFLVSYGRFAAFGDTFTIHYHYWSDLSIPLTLAVVLTARSVRPRPIAVRIAPAVALACLLAWTAGIVVSDARFATIWADNPSRPYFDHVTADLEQAGPAVNLWDTPMPPTVVTLLSGERRLSPVLRMAGVPFRLQGPGSDPYLVDDTGRLKPSHLAVWSRVDFPEPKQKTICGTLPLPHNRPVTRPLRPTQQELIEAEWFVKVGYFADRESRLRIELVDAAGRTVALPEPADAWPAGAAAMYFGPSARIRATAIRVRSTDPKANVCITSLEIGLPVVTG